MWKSYAITSISIFFLALASSSYAEDVLPPPLRCSKWVHFQVVLGRIQACQPRCQASHRLESIDDELDLCETLDVRSQSGVPAIDWQRTDPHETFSLTLEEGDVLSLTHICKVADVRVETRFTQPKTGPIQFAVTGGKYAVDHEAETIWHLLLLAPEACHTHLLPLLDRLRPHWKLGVQSQRLNHELMSIAQKQGRLDRSQLEQHIRHLDSRHYQTRQRADRTLRSFGFAALPFLQQLNREQLTSEQRLRVDRITAELKIGSGDTPHRMAQWLSGDKEIWLSLLSHGEAGVRKTAAIELSRLCDRPIDFDPDAVDVERRLQIDRLSHLLATD